jgi:hypothetical protein
MMGRAIMMEISSLLFLTFYVIAVVFFLLLKILRHIKSKEYTGYTREHKLCERCGEEIKRGNDNV